MYKKSVRLHNNKEIRRLIRYLGWSRAKRQALWDRYNLHLIYMLNRYGAGSQVANQEVIENKRLQIAISHWNKRFKEEI